MLKPYAKILIKIILQIRINEKPQKHYCFRDLCINTKNIISASKNALYALCRYLAVLQTNNRQTEVHYH